MFWALGITVTGTLSFWGRLLPLWGINVEVGVTGHHQLYWFVVLNGLSDKHIVK